MKRLIVIIGLLILILPFTASYGGGLSRAR